MMYHEKSLVFYIPKSFMNLLECTCQITTWNILFWEKHIHITLWPVYCGHWFRASLHGTVKVKSKQILLLFTTCILFNKKRMLLKIYDQSKSAIYILTCNNILHSDINFVIKKLCRLYVFITWHYFTLNHLLTFTPIPFMWVIYSYHCSGV